MDIQNLTLSMEYAIDVLKDLQKEKDDQIKFEPDRSECIHIAISQLEHDLNAIRTEYEQEKNV